MEKGLNLISCDMCGSELHKPEFKKDGLAAVRCGDCGLVFVNPQPSPEYLASEVYGEAYFDAEKGYGIEDALGAGGAEQRRRAEKLFRRLERDMKPGCVLDVGCAAGFMLDAARARGWTTAGSEISDFAARHAREKFRLDVRTGDFTALDFPPDNFDLVLMHDVIEHFTSPKKALLKAREVLKDGGRLVIGTPNYDCAPRRALGPGWGILQPEHHLFYFTPETLRRLLTETGFRLESLEFPLWGLTDLLLSAGSFQKAGIPVDEERKQFVRKHLRGVRDAARAVTSAVDRAVLTPLFRRRAGVAIFAIARKESV